VADDDLKRLLEAIQQENAGAHAETRRQFDAAVQRVDQRFDLLDESVATVNAETRRHESALARVDQRFDQLAESVAGVNTDTRGHVDAAVAETRRHFEVVLERVDARFDLLAESIASVNEELQRTRTTLDEKIDRSASETQAMIKFSTGSWTAG
jgi:prefoldin subunit 5